MLNSFINRLSELEANYQKLHYGIAVSGGADSMVLYALMRASKVQISVLHCNFNLRGNESQKDEDLVRTEASRNKHPLLLKSFEKADFKGNESTQMAARRLRYDWFSQLIETGKVDRIVTGHHADDQVETQLLHLIRGTGVKGLAGIPHRNGSVIRPLLHVWKNDILDYAKTHHIPFRTDSSNASDQYLRNRIRNEVIPLLNQIKPGVEQRLHQNASIFRAESIALDEYLESVLTNHVVHDSQSELFPPAKWSMHTLQLTLRKWLIGNGFHEDDVLTAMHWLINQNSVGGVLESDEYELYSERQGLRLVRTDASPQEVVIDQEGAYLNGFDEMTIHFTREFNRFEAGVEVMDSNRFEFPLTWRKWKVGDRFVPLGMKGSKLISDFLTDMKLEPYARVNQTVLVDDGGRVISIPGLRVSEEVKVTNQTTQFTLVRLLKK